MASEKQWRRTWKENLKAKPWKHIEIPFGDEVAYFLLKYHFSGESYEILITDFAQMWYEAQDGDAIMRRNKKLNPSIEAPLEKLIDHISESLQETKKESKFTVSYKTTEEEEKLHLTINSKLAGLPFIWKFSGKSANRDMVADQMTVPLMSMVAELSRRQQELCKILHAKDKEIDDLKGQGVKATRKHIETAPFDETAFQNSMQLSKGFEDNINKQGSSAFNSDGQNLYTEVMMKRAWLEQRDSHEELPGESQEISQTTGATGQSWGNRLPPSLAISPKKSPKKSAANSPAKSASNEPSPSKEVQSELLRRQALEKRLAEEEDRKEQKQKKKKKMKF